MVKRIEPAEPPLAHYIARFYKPGDGNDYHVGRTGRRGLDRPHRDHQARDSLLSVDIGHGAGYGNTLTWTERDKPKTTVQPVEIQVDLDKEKFYEMFVSLMSAH